MIETEKLPKEFTGVGEVKHFRFIQIKDFEHSYIYKVGNNYEVFEKRESPVCIDFQNRIYSETEFKEIYPKANSFGAWAWTFKDFKKAEQKAEQININKKNKLCKN